METKGQQHDLEMVPPANDGARQTNASPDPLSAPAAARSGHGSFIRQTKTLTWKIFLLKTRAWKSTACEFLLPVVVGLLLSLVRTSFSSTHYDTNFHATAADKSPAGCSYVSKAIPLSMHLSTIAIAPDDSATRAFGSWLTTIYNTTVGNSTYSFQCLGAANLVYYSTEAAIENFVSGSSYDNSINASIVFYSLGGNNPSYSLRFPSSSVPSTTTYTYQFNSGFSALNYYNTYLYSGFLNLQSLVDEYLSMNILNMTLQQPNSFFQLYMNQFPTVAYTQDNFWTVMSRQAIVFMMIVFMWPFTRLVKMVIEENTLKIREGMKMMGMTDAAFYVSYVLIYGAIFIVSNAILTGILFINAYVTSSALYVFFSLLGFSIPLIALALLFTVLFKNTRTTLYVSQFVFLGGFLIYKIATNLSYSAMLALSLYAPYCFAVMVGNIASLEEAQVGLSAQTADMVVAGTPSFNACMGMLMLDAVIYLILAWYVGNVLPQEYGARRKWWFVFDISGYWCPPADGNSGSYESVISSEDFAHDVPRSELYDQADVEVAGSSRHTTGVRIRNLRKEYDNGVVGVDGLSLDIAEGEVFALLGHNGAGKTTTMSMLTGLISPTSGEAVVSGYLLTTQLDSIRASLGVCPQTNVLFDDLTVEEHIKFFSGLRGVDWQESAHLIEEVGLVEKTHARSSTLSGGQKRKLGVAIAFIGDPKIIFLDEPTSGMDVHSRRSTWELIKRKRAGRAIVLSTHFMDEADLLADRIAIMAKGKLVCCGSSLFLKNKYGVGYSLIISKNSANDPTEPILKAVGQFLPDAAIVNDVGGEVFLRTAFANSHSFPAMFRDLEAHKVELGIANVGISVTTLEEVFLKVGRNEAVTDDEKKEDGALKRRISDSHKQGFTNLDGPGEAEIAKLMKRSARQERPAAEMAFVHFVALLKKRVQVLRRDRFHLAFLVLLPLAMLLLGIQAIKAISTTTSVSLGMDLSHYATPSPVAVSSPSLETLGSSLAQPVFLAANITRLSFSTTLLTGLSTQNTRYGAFQDSGLSTGAWGVTVWANQTGVHALPVFFNLLTNSILQNSSALPAGGASVTMASYPLPQTATEKLFLERLSAIFVSLFFNQALIFVPATFVVYIVSERVSKAKHQQLISGVSVPAYWLSNYAFDLACYMLPFIISIIMLTKGLKSTIFTGDALPPTILMFFLLGTATIPFTYLESHLFNNALTARVVVMLTSYLFGPILSLVSFSLNYAGGTASQVNSDLIWLYRVFPGYNLGNGLLNIAANFKGDSPWSVCRDDYVYLIWTSVVYTIAVIVLEYMLSVPRIAFFFRALLKLEKDVPETAFPEDDDVVAERNRVAHEGNEDEIRILGVRKVYNGEKVAVQDLWYGVPQGQCFGFLGINGAGKTTTMEVLTGDIFPTRGTGKLAGFDILTHQLSVRRLIGYCPQFDALFPLLTAREHLYFYARIKGVDETQLPEIVAGMIHYLSLEEYADRPAGTYSGGNKRKLSVAVALIGDPPLVFLDEPSTGMDPVARRFMWRFIAETMPGRSVILTTHSMDECEALCHRLGIMVGGRLRCLGTPQHIKNKFGTGWQLHISSKNGDQLLAGMQALFPGVRLLERHEGALNMQIPFNVCSNLADVFEAIESKKAELAVKEYSVSQMSLEQIFIHFAQQQDEEKGVAKGFQGMDGLLGTPAETKAPVGGAAGNPTPNEMKEVKTDMLPETKLEQAVATPAPEEAKQPTT